MDFQNLMKQARAYSGALDLRDQQVRVAQQVRMPTQQRAQTIQSMQTKKYELDERKLGFSQPRTQSVPQPKTQYVSALPILDTAHSVVNPVLNQNNPLRSSFQTAMPNASMMQQATNNFRQWNKQYEQDEDLYIDAVDRVSSLAGWGAPPDEEANRQLAESEAKLNQTKEQEDSMLRQTLTMLGPGAEGIIKAAYKDATDRPGAGYNAQYTQEERERRAQNQKRAQELENRIGADLYAKLYHYVYEQDTAAKAERQRRKEAEAAAKRRHALEAKYYTLSSVSASKDFEEKSQYHSTAKDSQPSLMTWLIDNAVDGGTSDWDDPLYEAVNGNEEARAYLETKAATRYGAGDNALGALYGNVAEGMQEVKQMTEEQVGVFNYLYATQGKEVAHEYYEILKELELNPKQRAEEQEALRQWANDGWGGAIGSSIFSVAVSPLKVLSAAGQFVDYTTTGKIDENAGYNRFAQIPSTIRGAVAQKAEEKWGPVASFAYQTGMSMADFLYNSALTGAWAGQEALGKEAFRLASNMSLAIMGSGAAADATIEAKERGLTDKQAFTLGAVAGAAEILTEKFSIENLLTGKWEDSAIKFILKNAFVEGSEEVGSDVINMIADVLVAKDKSQWKQSIQAYRNSGLSEEEAFRRAMMDQALEMGLDYLGGVLSGGIMAGMQAWGNREYWQNQRAMMEANKKARNHMDTDQRGNVPAADFAQEQTQEGQTSRSLQQAKEDLERAQRAALARNETERTGILAGATTRQIQQAQRVGKLVRREVLFFSEGQDASGGMQNGYYNTGDGRIYVNTQSGDPAVQVISHELTHSIEKSRFYAKLQQVVLKKIKADGLDLDTLRAEKQALYERHGVTDVDADAEIVAEYVAKNLLTDEQSIRSLVMESQTLGQRIMEFIDQLLAMMGNKNAQERELLSKARRYYQKALVDSWGQEATMRQGWFNGGYDSGLDLQDGLGGNRYSIEKLPNGEKYVRADRQVIFGNNTKAWGEQVEEYINWKIRRGQDVQMTTEDGDTLTLTSDTAGKAKFPYNPDGSRMSDAQYETKLNAEAHIDELVAVSTRGNTEPDKDGRHGAFAEHGWNYRTAYFRDFDGTHYRLKISVAQGADGNVVYNVGGIRKRDIPTSSGPSAKRGAQGGDAVSTNSIAESPEFGNRKFSISEEKNLPELYRAQLRALERLNLAASKEYDGYVEQLNRYRLQQQAKKVLEEYYAAVHENKEAINELKRAYRDWVREQNLNREVEEDN